MTGPRGLGGGGGPGRFFGYLFFFGRNHEKLELSLIFFALWVFD
jgi:hypothetical protein